MESLSSIATGRTTSCGRSGLQETRMASNPGRLASRKMRYKRTMGKKAEARFSWLSTPPHGSSPEELARSYASHYPEPLIDLKPRVSKSKSKRLKLQRSLLQVLLFRFASQIWPARRSLLHRSQMSTGNRACGNLPSVCSRLVGKPEGIQLDEKSAFRTSAGSQGDHLSGMPVYRPLGDYSTQADISLPIGSWVGHSAILAWSGRFPNRRGTRTGPGRGHAAERLLTNAGKTMTHRNPLSSASAQPDYPS